MKDPIVDRVSTAIRNALDPLGIELTWHDTDLAAAAVVKELDEELDYAWRYMDMADS